MKILLKKNNKPKKVGTYILGYLSKTYIVLISKDPFTGVKHAIYGDSCVPLRTMGSELTWSDAIKIEEEK